MQDIQDSYSDWLQRYHWEYFFTSTFREPRREPYYAMKAVWAELSKYYVARAFIGVEPHNSGDLHLHGIIAGRGEGWKPEIRLPWEIWHGLFKRFGRAKVEACNSQEKVSAYCSKYILKAQNNVVDHYSLFGSKNAWKLI